MQIVERGIGEPLVLIPGIQGRWEYQAPAVTALARRFRVITFPLADEPSADCAFDRGSPFDAYVAQVQSAMDQAGVETAIVCGVSFGGLIALRAASALAPRVSRLVLVSTPGPHWQLRPRHTVYARFPRLFGPLFLVETAWRLRQELSPAFADRGVRWRFVGEKVRTLIQAPVSTGRLAARAMLIPAADAAVHARRIRVPSLIITGEAALDHVVDADGSAEYARLVPGARSIVLERTGHLGTITRPEAFAQIVADFASGASDAAA